jgi:hypothetical protein
MHTQRVVIPHHIILQCRTINEQPIKIISKFCVHMKLNETSINFKRSSVALIENQSTIWLEVTSRDPNEVPLSVKRGWSRWFLLISMGCEHLELEQLFKSNTKDGLISTSAFSLPGLQQFFIVMYLGTCTSRGPDWLGRKRVLAPTPLWKAHNF